jgi:hypothetical protein
MKRTKRNGIKGNNKSYSAFGTFMLKKIVLSALLTIPATQLYGMIDAEKTVAGTIKEIRQPRDIDDISGYCAAIARVLSEQPIEKDARGDTYKMVPCRPEDGYMCKFLSPNARKILPSAWLINVDHGYADIQRNVALHLYISEDHQMCSLENLEKVYKKVIEKLKNGWRQSTAKEQAALPEYLQALLQCGWHLLVKKASLFNEERLIWFLDFKFDVCNLFCWVKPEKGPCGIRGGDYDGYAHGDELYLFVSEDSFEEFKRIFKFQIKPANSDSDDQIKDLSCLKK